MCAKNFTHSSCRVCKVFALIRMSLIVVRVSVPRHLSSPNNGGARRPRATMGNGISVQNFYTPE